MSPAIVLTRGSSRPGPVGLADVEQQELAHALGLAVGPGERALLQDAPRQLLAEKARAAGDHHLHVVSIPAFLAADESVHRSASQSMLRAMAGTTEIFVFKDALIVLGTAARRGAGGAPPQDQSDPRFPRRRCRAGAARPRPSRRVIRAPSTGSPSTGERQIAFIADLGIVFLLFFIGLELSMRAPAHHAPPGVRPGRRCRSLLTPLAIGLSRALARPAAGRR